MKSIGNFNEFYISLIPYCKRSTPSRSELRRGLFELRRVLILSSAGFNLSSAGLLDDGNGGGAGGEGYISSSVFLWVIDELSSAAQERPPNCKSVSVADGELRLRFEHLELTTVKSK